VTSPIDRVVDSLDDGPEGSDLAQIELSPDEQLAADFAEIARDIQREPTLASTLPRIVELAVSTVPGCQHAAITINRRGKFETIASTSDVARTVDSLQYETGEGPCVDSMRAQETFRTGDLGAEPRWPKFGPLVTRLTGIHSMLSFRLFAEEDTLGALNLSSCEADAFGDESLPTAAVFATHAALAFARAQAQDQVQELEQALATNREIAMAMGILMSQHQLTEQDAFAVLRVVSQNLNRKLREIASEVVRTGAVPDSN
jgi:GAF domain-containing protein